MSMGEGMDKQNVTYTNSGGLFSLKMKGVLTHCMVWIHSGDTPLSDVSQSQKGNYCTTLHMRDVWSSDIQRQKAHWWLAAGEGDGKQSLNAFPRQTDF